MSKAPVVALGFLGVACAGRSIRGSQSNGLGVENHVAGFCGSDPGRYRILDR